MTTSNAPRYGTGSNLSKSMNGYMKSTDRSPYREENDLRESLDNVSQASQIPLDPVIKKTTSVHITSGPSQGPKELQDSNETLSDWNNHNKPDRNSRANPTQSV